MKKFILKLSLLILPLLALVLSITFLKDPGQILANRYLEIKNVLLEGKNAQLYSVPAAWGKFHEAYLQGRKEKGMAPLTLVTWGSSRSSEIRAEQFPGETYYNCVIPGSDVKDYIALYGLFKEQKCLPKTIVLTIDPWTFYARKQILSNGQTFTIQDDAKEIEVKEELTSYYSKAMLQINGTVVKKVQAEETWRKKVSFYLEFLSPSYFQYSLKALAEKPVTATSEEYVPNAFVIRQDGSYTLFKPNAEEIAAMNNRAKDFGQLTQGHFFCDACATGSNMDLLLALLNQLEKEKIKVILFVSPLHPAAYKEVIEEEKNELEIKLRQVCKERNLLLIGAADPARYGLEPMASDPDFLDEYHVTYKAMKKIFATHQSEINQQVDGAGTAD